MDGFLLCGRALGDREPIDGCDEELFGRNQNDPVAHTQVMLAHTRTMQATRPRIQEPADQEPGDPAAHMQAMQVVQVAHPRALHQVLWESRRVVIAFQSHARPPTQARVVELLHSTRLP